MELSAIMKKKTVMQSKIHKVMHEFKHGELHSGSKHGPEVSNRKQAVAIALSEGRKAEHGGYEHKVNHSDKHMGSSKHHHGGFKYHN